MLSAIFLLPSLLLVSAQHCGPEELDSVGERVTACVIRCLPQVSALQDVSFRHQESLQDAAATFPGEVYLQVRDRSGNENSYFYKMLRGGGLRHSATDPGGVWQHVGGLLHTARGGTRSAWRPYLSCLSVFPIWSMITHVIS